MQRESDLLSAHIGDFTTKGLFFEAVTKKKFSITLILHTLIAY